jgi:type IV pilus assembly protein PilP
VKAQMSKIGKYILMTLVAVAMSGVMSCGEKAPPENKTPVVKKKISAQQRSAGQKSVPSPGKPADQIPAPDVKAANDTAADASGGKEASALVEASLKLASSYDPKGRFDPFEPLFKEEPSAPVVVTNKDQRKKRVPQTPLERVALSQLKLSAIMRTPRGNSAVVEDATGKGYVIKKGTYIGLNSGQVIVIDRARVVVEEEIENVMGELIIQNTELKLQKPAGEL